MIRIAVFLLAFCCVAHAGDLPDAKLTRRRAEGHLDRLDFTLQKVDAAVSDYQRGFIDGIAKARELVAAAKGRYSSRGMFGTAAQEALEETAQLLNAAVNPPTVTR